MCTRRGLGSSPASGRRSSEQGFVVLGLLILIVVAVVTGVLIGKVMYASQYRYEVPLGHRELWSAVEPVDVRYGALITGRLAPRQAVWVRAVGDGRLAVFEDRDSARVVGFVAATELIPLTGAHGQFR
ncbi:hypothetical protein BH23GEM6_BH23GEM6_23630 [soil metagenome]